MQRLHRIIVIAAVLGSLLSASAIAWPTVADAREAPGPWRPPVGPVDVATRFDPPPLPWLAGHRGIDLTAVTGRPVHAAGSGTVVYAADLAGRGVVSIDHLSGLRTTYEPVEPVVEPGQAVTAGDVIGHLAPGHGSCPFEACLHLGLKRGPVYLDPLLLFGSGQVRLLPRPDTRVRVQAGAAEQAP